MHERFTITDIRVENYRTRTLTFDRALPAQPGQFVMVWLPGVDERPYSVAGADPLALTVVEVGPFSEALQRLDVGDAAWVRGPLGHGFRLPDGSNQEHLLLAGGGYGVAPLLFLAREALRAGHAVTACVGARTSDDVLLTGAFAEAGATVVVATDDGSRGTRGLVTDVVDMLLSSTRFACVYGCGPVAMLEALERRCFDRDVPHQLSWEARMRCGLGLCGACEVHRRPSEPSRPGLGGWLACHDGPVAEGGAGVA